MSDLQHAISCTSNGALRLVHLGAEENAPSTQTGVLPMRLCDWRLSHSGETFAYGGDEVELSVWNTEAAFTRLPAGDSGSESKKRKRDQLLPGEVWRAKNLPNDGLGLRRPVHITALIYLQPSSSISHHHLLAGTQEGHIRRYDTRAARRPVANWERIGKMGGISTAEKGLHEHEVFVGDHGYNLMALDLRNGRVIYGYKGLSGAVSSIAPSPELLASACQDRFLRLHSTFPPPAVEGQQQEHKGEVVDKLYMKVIPAAVVWDGISDSMRVADAAADSDDEEGAEDDVWDAMDDAEDDDDEFELNTTFVSLSAITHMTLSMPHDFVPVWLAGNIPHNYAHVATIEWHEYNSIYPSNAIFNLIPWVYTYGWLLTMGSTPSYGSAQLNAGRTVSLPYRFQADLVPSAVLVRLSDNEAGEDGEEPASDAPYDLAH
ncbi:predicted protein [Postia placenta Mad-698-R]|nr:predicted protein [Postia placenta Mad-698-R]